MKYFFVILILSCSSVPTSAVADREGFDLCILGHLQGAKLDMATHYIRQACFDIYEKKGKPRRNMEYNTCLLENLIGVESSKAVIEINTACSSLYRD
jgi:hypothetical protein